MSLRREFVRLASVEGANVSALCRQFGVSRKTAYKWIGRYRSEGEAGLVDRSRRPKTLRTPTSAEMELRVLAVRDEHPAWGGRKIRARLLALGETSPPAASTITEILRRHGRITTQESARRKPFQRFERARPNELWQIDFKGEFKMSNGRYCFPLTLLDDHSRYAIGLIACGNQRRGTVKSHLTTIFRRYGMPEAIFSDNGPPWGSIHSPTRHTRLTAWLMRLDVQVIHGTPFHPQGRGKEERFHRTLKAELLQDRRFDNLSHTQRRFDPWREMYNQERPHEALGLDVPASRYHTSSREFPERITAFNYSDRFQIRNVNKVGQFHFSGHVYKASEAFSNTRVGLSPTQTDGVWDVYYCHFRIGRLDERTKGGPLQRVAGGSPSSARYARSRRRTTGDND